MNKTYALIGAALIAGLLLVGLLLSGSDKGLLGGTQYQKQFFEGGLEANEIDAPTTGKQRDHGSIISVATTLTKNQYQKSAYFRTGSGPSTFIIELPATVDADDIGKQSIFEVVSAGSGAVIVNGAGLTAFDSQTVNNTTAEDIGDRITCSYTAVGTASCIWFTND